MAPPPSPSTPARGDVWMVDFDPTVGHEQAGRRPALIVSHDELNRSPAGLIVVLPLTGSDRNISVHVRIAPPSGGLTKPSIILTDQPRAISKKRLGARLGSIPAETLIEVEAQLRRVLGL